jgi:CBS domain-containing protein
MLLREIMTPAVEAIAPGDTLEHAARRMEELDVGPLPVCDGGRVVGLLTDRDVAVRAVAAGCNPRTTLVSDVMTHDVVCGRDDQDVAEAARLMERHQVRRLPVLGRDGALVGIVSLGDLATAGGAAARPGAVLKAVSEPS